MKAQSVFINLSGKIFLFHFMIFLFRLSLWVYSCFVLVKAFGWLAILFIFLFQLITPIAIFTLLLAGHWIQGSILVGGMVLIYALNLFLQRQSQNTTPPFRPSTREQGTIIDIDAQVEEGPKTHLN